MVFCVPSSTPKPFATAIKLIRKGRSTELDALLGQHPELATLQPTDNPRSLLHHATDWPGHWANVADTIGVLVTHGADVEARFPSDTPRVAETPLHWAASSGDVDAVNALLDAGADVDVLGGVFDGCTPFEEAIIFEKFDAAHVLLAHGAKLHLPGAAALGLAERVADFFEADGSLNEQLSQRPHQEQPPPPQDVLDRAFQFACRSGQLEIAKDLLGRGADPSATSPANTTALEWAVENEHHEVARWLNALPPTD